MIAKAYMDGTNNTMLVSDDVFAPAALAIDAVKRLLYWSDAHLDAVSCVEYTGLHRYRTCIVRFIFAPPSSLLFVLVYSVFL